MSTTTLARLLQRHRVNIARAIWAALIVYLFGIERVAVHSLTSSMGQLGLAVVSFGVLVRAYSAGLLVKNTQLTTGGIYAMVRNPLYFGSLVLLVGVNIIIAHPVAVAVTALLFAMTYIPTIRREEAGLEKAYGDAWRAYKASTPRLFPNPLKLGELRHSQWSPRQWFQNHEMSTLLAAVAILSLLEYYQRTIGH